MDATWRSPPARATWSAGDTNDKSDAFVHDRRTGKTGASESVPRRNRGEVWRRGPVMKQSPEGRHSASHYCASEAAPSIPNSGSGLEHPCRGGIAACRELGAASRTTSTAASPEATAPLQQRRAMLASRLGTQRHGRRQCRNGSSQDFRGGTLHQRGQFPRGAVQGSDVAECPGLTGKPYRPSDVFRCCLTGTDTIHQEVRYACHMCPAFACAPPQVWRRYPLTLPRAGRESMRSLPTSISTGPADVFEKDLDTGTTRLLIPRREFPEEFEGQVVFGDLPRREALVLGRWCSLGQEISQG